MIGSEMVIFKRSLPSKLGIPHESTSLWHVQTTKDHSHTPRYTRDMISYPLYFFRLIDRGLKSASGSASRLPAAVTAAPMALGMPPEHQLSGPSQPGAAQEPPGAPTGRHRAHPCQARPGAISAGLQESTKVARRAAGEAAAGGGDGRGDDLPLRDWGPAASHQLRTGTGDSVPSHWLGTDWGLGTQSPARGLGLGTESSADARDCCGTGHWSPGLSHLKILILTAMSLDITTEL